MICDRPYSHLFFQPAKLNVKMSEIIRLLLKHFFVECKKEDKDD
jgi:hypothetical protein